MISACWDNVDYPVTQPFLPGPPAIHCGIDIGCPVGTIIKAARTGLVETVETGIVGIHVDGSSQRDFYLHGHALVVEGEHIEAGTPVISSDTVQVSPAYPLTGPHLHFEVQDGFTLPGAPPAEPGHPLDPVPVLEGVMQRSEMVSVLRAYLRQADPAAYTDANLNKYGDIAAAQGLDVAMVELIAAFPPVTPVATVPPGTPISFSGSVSISGTGTATGSGTTK